MKSKCYLAPVYDSIKFGFVEIINLTFKGQSLLEFLSRFRFNEKSLRFDFLNNFDRHLISYREWTLLSFEISFPK